MFAKSTSRQIHFAILLSSTALFSVGGCGGGSDLTSSIPKPHASELSLTKTIYSTGEAIALNALPSAPTAASLVFSDGRTFTIPIMPDGSVLVPVLSADLAAQTVKLSVATARGLFRSQDIRLQPIAITTSRPGVATLIYLDATIAHVGSAIDELVTMSGDPLTTDAAELQEISATLVLLRHAIEQAQSGSDYELSASSDMAKLYIDNQQLEIFDQYVMAMLRTTAAAPTAAASGAQPGYIRPASVPSGMASAKTPGISILSAAVARSSIGSLDCMGLADPADRAWCANMRTQIASDYIINYAGMVGVVGGTASAALGALAAIGVAGVAGPAVLIGTVALGTVVVANMVAGAVQGASAYGTGTSQGTNVRDNITNLVNAARGYVTGNIAKMFPNGGSDLIKTINKTVTKVVAPGVFSTYDKLVEKYTKPVTACTAQAVSGGQGSFANRYDFGSARALRLSYEAFGVPDQFSVFDGSGSVAGTGGLVSGGGTLSFTSTSRYVTVKVNAPTSGTGWNFTISCAD